MIDFDFQFDLSGPRGQAFLASVEFLTSELGRPGGLAEMPLAREQLEAFILSQLLTAVRHPYTDELTAPAEPARVRAELAGGRDPEAKVTDVAMRWGFFHPSRFAQQYKERYGELPSETVKRCTS